MNIPSAQRSARKNRARLDALVAVMYADYQSGMTLAEVGAKHGARSMTSIYALFKKRGLARRTKAGPKTYQRIAAKRRAHLDALVQQMYADYQQPMSLAAVGRKYGIDRRSVRENFERRGLTVRPSPCVETRHRDNGRWTPYVPFTDEQLEELIARTDRLHVPIELKLEWRKWSLERRGWFISRLREKLKLTTERPALPFSNNVEPFDYATPCAHDLVRRTNEGTDSRGARIKLDICSQGVIWSGRLWFWSHKVGYQSGPWTPEHGRPSLHKTIWEEKHGRNLPPGHVIRFADGNPNNLNPDNLVLATRNEVCRANQAEALMKKSRATTALLLDRAQRENPNEYTDTLTKLRAC